MIWRALAYLLRNQRRFQYPGVSRLAFQIVGAYLTLLVYWLTSKSLEGFSEFASRWGSNSYFEFLLIGELVLVLPMSLVSSWPYAVRQLASEGMIDDLRLHPKGLWLPVSVMGASLQFRELVQILLTVILAYSFFGFSVAPASLLLIFALVLFLTPAFVGLGLLASSVLLATGRGEGVVGQVLNLAAIFAGAYFPLSVLDPLLAKALTHSSPFTLLLESARDLATSQPLHWSAVLAVFGAWNILTLGLGFTAFQWFSQRMGRRDFPVLSPQ